jgi:hypothetical protein
MKLGDVVPDLTFVTGPGRSARFSEICPGAGVLVFLRHLA